MRPPHALALGSLLLVGLALGALAGPAAAADPVQATDGTTYDHGIAIAVDVAADESYSLRTSDGAFVAQYAAPNGTVTIDTGDLRNGDYALENASGATVFAFGVEGAPTTTDDADGADETRPLESGATYDAGVTLTRDVSGDAYALRTGDGAFVAEYGADGGTLTVETTGLDGDYVLRDAEGDTVASFTVDGADETTTTTTTTTTTSDETASVGPTDDETDAHAPLERTVDAADGGVYWRGLALRFDASADATLRTGDGAFVAEYAPEDGAVTVDTAGLDAGEYRLDAAETTAFSVARQTLDASSAEGALAVSSNREGYPLVLQSAALDAEALHALVPASEMRDDGVVVTDVSRDAALDVDADAVAAGNYSVTAVAGDTGVRDDATVSVNASENTTVTPIPPVEDGTTTPADESTTETTATTTAANESTTATTTTATTTVVDETTGNSPGFGSPAGGLALALAGAGLLGRRRD